MSCQLTSRITTILLLTTTTTLFLCLTSHGSVFNRNQNLLVGRKLQNVKKLEGEEKFNLEISEQQQLNASSWETPSRLSSQTRPSVLLGETKNSKSSSTSHHSNETYMFTPPQGGADVKELFQSDSPGPDSP